MGIDNVWSIPYTGAIPNNTVSRLYRALFPTGTITGVRVKLEGGNAAANVVFGLALNGVAMFTTELTVASGTDEIEVTGLSVASTNDTWGVFSIESPFTSGALDNVTSIGFHVEFATTAVQLTGTQTIAGVKTFTSDPIIPDEAYDATAWNGSLEPPTKNAVRDKIESMGSGVSDGDKGDITVSGSGATWTIDNDVVTYAKMQNVSATDRLLGRDTAGAGDVEELTVSGGVEFTGTGIQRSALTGDVTASAGSNSTTIANDAVTYAKLQNISATSRVLGRKTSGAGDAEECTLSEVLDFIGSAAQGDILYRGAATWARLAAGTSGYYLQTLGAGANPQWAAVSAGGGSGTFNIDDGTSTASGTFTFDDGAST